VLIPILSVLIPILLRPDRDPLRADPDPAAP
jgi:hypothetical protein